MAYRVLAFLVALLPACSAGQSSRAIPFTGAGIQSVVGHDVCAFEGDFPNQFGVDLDRSKEYAVQYRERDGRVAVFLLRNPSARCGVVVASLDLTSMIHAGETVEFKCYTSREGGTVLGKWGQIVGLGDNENGKNRFARARLAWKVDLKEKRFVEIASQTVTCDTSGYSN
jgi:hypothetical protein